MATIYSTGMSYQTSRQFRRVAEDIKQYANSVYEYNESNPMDYYWYDPRNTISGGMVNYTGSVYATQSSLFYPTYISASSPATLGLRDRNKMF